MKVNKLLELVTTDMTNVMAAKITTYSASTVGLAASFAEWNWTAIIASVTAVFSFLMSWYFQIKKERREERESEAKIAEHHARIKAINEGRL